MDDFIQLKKDNILRIGIKDSNGVDTGEHLEFDLESISLPLKINECEIKHIKNLEYLKAQFLIIDKKENKKGKYLLSSNEKEKLEVVQEFYKREIEALDLFLGKDGTRKLLNGREPYISMYEDITEIVRPILPKIKITSDEIANKIKGKYNKTEETGVLE